MRNVTAGKITTVEHAGTSRNGNPTYRIVLEDGRKFLTKTDSSIGYAATNFRPRWQDEPRTATIVTDGRGRVVDLSID